ncbi:hypothetical protein [Chromobacterium violaceum]|uniref:hypothetical protein n=1 Tax=Chromobacterium violaceum TaxID=536 RepID=UPI0011250CCE|nr:hypothetical protein [Chromobacterium violaceum]MBA8735585.1 hypothetical protein [Chromobacterium violaceum]
MLKFRTAILPILLSIFLTSCYNKALEYKELARNYKITIGHAAAMNCTNHGEFYYIFDVDGKKYSNKGLSGGADCGSLKEGDELSIYYSPDNPSINTNIDPNTAYSKKSGFYIPDWLWILFPIIIVVSQILFLLHKNAKNNDK